MKKTIYKLVCRTCGKQFETTHPRINCDACGKVRNAGAAAHEIMKLSEAGNLITGKHVKEMAARYECSVGGVYSALRRLGFKSTTAWLRTTPSLEHLDKKENDNG